MLRLFPWACNALLLLMALILLLQTNISTASFGDLPGTTTITPEKDISPIVNLKSGDFSFT